MQPFRFAVYTNDGTHADEWSAFARRVEELGYAALYVTDHLNRQLAPTAALAAAAAEPCGSVHMSGPMTSATR